MSIYPKAELNESLAYITSAVGVRRGPEVVAAVSAWLQRHRSMEAALVRALSLAHVRAFRGPEETPLRRAQRAHLLVQGTVGGLTLEQLRLAVPGAHRMTLKEVKVGILAMYDAAKEGDRAQVMPIQGLVVLSQSFQYSRLKQPEMNLLFRAAKQLMARAWVGVGQARLAGAQQTAYETWFGPWDQRRFEVVKANLKVLHDTLCVRPIKLYYRGAGVRGATDEPGGRGTMRSQRFFCGAYTKAPVRFDPRFTHIFVGRAFDKAASIYTPDTLAGVMIHELAHALFGALDVNDPRYGDPSFGPKRCTRLAKGHPELAIKNADNYELFCEGFQGGGWTQGARTVAPGRLTVADRSVNLLGRGRV